MFYGRDNMCDFLKDLVTSNTFLTVISGVLVFVISQMFNEYWLRPIQNYKELRAKISYDLTLYANLYMNPVKYELLYETKERDSAANELRMLAAEVDSFVELRPWGNIFIARKKVLSAVSKNLIGLSNSLYSPNPSIAADHNDKTREEIYNLLKIKNK